MPRTNSAAMCLPRTASAAPTPHLRLRGKMGEWFDLIFVSWAFSPEIKTPLTNDSLYSSVTFCAEHARRNAMALRAQMRKPLSSPSPETLLSQLSGYSRAEMHGVDGGRSEASRLLGKSCLEIPCQQYTHHSCKSSVRHNGGKPMSKYV